MYPLLLQSLGVEQYADAFETEEVALEYVYTLTEAELLSLGVQNPGHLPNFQQSALMSPYQYERERVEANCCGGITWPVMDHLYSRLLQ